MIEKYIDYIETNNYKELATLFDPKCKYFDYCAQTNYHIYGNRAIEMFFHNQFFFRQFKIYDYVIENDTCANFMVSYKGAYVHARATIESLNEDGLIKEMIIRLA